MLCIQLNFSLFRGQSTHETRAEEAKLRLRLCWTSAGSGQGGSAVATLQLLRQPPKLAGEGLVDVAVEKWRHRTA